MNISDLLNGVNIFKKYKKVDLKQLPSMNLFYKDDFTLSIKKADMEDMVEYDTYYDNENVLTMLSLIRKIVKNNTKFSNGYKFEDLIEYDLLYVFISIVKYTKGKDVTLPHNGKDISFFDNFKYTNINEAMKYYDNTTKQFAIDGFRYSLPTVGVSIAIQEYMMDKYKSVPGFNMEGLSHNFIYFLNGKNTLSFSEIENLYVIFNQEMEKKDKDIISSIIQKMSFQYKVLDGQHSIDIGENLKLQNIWK